MLIAFSGKKQTGKDTAAELLAAASPKLQFQGLNFADAVYEELAIGLWPACSVNRAFLATKIAYMKANKQHFRLLLQGWGTDYRRALFGANYWIDEYKKRLERIPDKIVVVTTDVRFVNEAQCIAALGGILIRIERETGMLDTHQSEVELDDYHFEHRVTNNGTKEQLLEQLKKALKNT